jgi:DUF4097 and DUF4098 domain-containing protein YvlB
MRKLWLIPIAWICFFTGMAIAQTSTQELPASPGETLVFDLKSGGDIEVIGWDQDGASVTTEIKGRDAEHAQVDVTRSGDGIRVSSPNNRRNQRFDLIVRVKVPRRYDVEIKTMGGDVKLEGLEGEFGGETMGGDVTLASLDGQASVSTMGGDISVRASTLDGKVSTMGGDIDLDDVQGNLDAKTMGGDITESNVRRTGGRDAEAVQVSSHGGDVEVDTAPVGANVKTMGGDIEVRSVDQFLTAVTMGGDVTVERATGDADITTMGGDIEVGSFDGGMKAKTMGGDIDVNVISSSAAADSHDIDLDSKGGDLRLALPSGFSGRFEIEVVKLRKRPDDARIESDFPLDINEPAEWTNATFGKAGKYGGDYKIITATGTTGGGDHLVKLKTINGVVRITRQ